MTDHIPDATKMVRRETCEWRYYGGSLWTTRHKKKPREFTANCLCPRCGGAIVAKEAE